MDNWWTTRRIVFLILGVLALGLASFNASLVPPDRRIAHFIGGSIWAVLFFVIALWPQRKREPRRQRPGSDDDRS
ncbi:hypothetical protein [Fimbriiglobus ruber]|uniref:Uncharacterized protein n=1 Tax=Fimbriiglobus ruber TaxID=1908690 RepID=A0A225DA79_9BACT|nr:hypothetical protein [Fimbriiglobus ruber]OWK38362.1 hypothetical protein FRUB_07482 [Fimbriiglobus ruber]